MYILKKISLTSFVYFPGTARILQITISDRIVMPSETKFIKWQILWLVLIWRKYVQFCLDSVGTFARMIPSDGDAPVKRPSSTGNLPTVVDAIAHPRGVGSSPLVRPEWSGPCVNWDILVHFSAVIRRWRGGPVARTEWEPQLKFTLEFFLWKKKQTKWNLNQCIGLRWGNRMLLLIY